MDKKPAFRVTLALLLLPLATSAVEQRNLALAADTYIQRGSSTNFGAATTFRVKRDFATSAGGTDRIGYVRFQTSAPLPNASTTSLIPEWTEQLDSGTWSPNDFTLHLRKETETSETIEAVLPIPPDTRSRFIRLRAQVP